MNTTATYKGKTAAEWIAAAEQAEARGRYFAAAALRENAAAAAGATLGLAAYSTI
jgi:hypothetical protein